MKIKIALGKVICWKGIQNKVHHKFREMPNGFHKRGSNIVEVLEDKTALFEAQTDCSKGGEGNFGYKRVALR